MSQDLSYPRINVVDADGNLVSFGGAGSGGDASSDNQSAQILLETAIRDRLPSGGTASEATLAQVRDAIKAQIAIASTVFTDNSGAFYIRRDLINEGTGAITISFTDPSGTSATPGVGLRPLATTDKDTITDFYDVLTGGTGYSVGDLLARIAILDANSGSPSATFIWLNLTLGTILGSAPTSANIERANENVGARQVGPWSTRLLDAGGTNQATIKGASTQQLLTDTALVTASRDKNGTVLAGTAGSLNADILPSTDVNGYSWLSLQISGTWGGSITIQGCNDNTNWNTLGYQATTSVGFINSGIIGSTNGLYEVRLACRYLRIRMTAYSSGTATGDIVLFKDARPYSGISGINNVVTISGSTTSVISSTNVKAQTYSQGTINTSGDNTIIAAPGASIRIYITSITVQLEAATATTILFKSAATTFKRVFCQNQGDGISLQHAPGFELRLGANEAFILNLSGANIVGYSVEYYTA